MKKIFLLTFFACTLFSSVDKDPILKRHCKSAETLVVAFGGLGTKLGKSIPPFEFFRMLSPFNVHQMYVRDLQGSWYQRGLRQNQTMEEAIEEIKGAVNCFQAKRVIFIGNSAGGYASLLFGLLLNVDEVHAFVPFTNLDISKLNDKDKLRSKYFYLAPLFAQHPNISTQFHLYYCSDCPHDLGHARNLTGKNIHHHVYQKRGAHGLITRLKKDGELLKMLKEIIDRSNHLLTLRAEVDLDAQANIPRHKEDDAVDGYL